MAKRRDLILGIGLAAVLLALVVLVLRSLSLGDDAAPVRSNESPTRKDPRGQARRKLKVQRQGDGGPAPAREPAIPGVPLDAAP